MNINEIICNYEEAREKASYFAKQEKYLKSLINDYIKTNNIANLETTIKEKITFETDEYIVMLKKNIQNRFDQTSFFEYIGQDVKKEFEKPTITLTYEATKKEEKIA